MEWASADMLNSRHADVKTTLKIYAHVIPQSQRDAMEKVGGQSLPNPLPYSSSRLNDSVQSRLVGAVGIEPHVGVENA